MSLTYSQITTLIDANCKSDSTSYPIAQKTIDINNALDKVFSLIFGVGGTWQFDDTSHPDHPIITTSLISGQRDYSFSTDGNSNLVLEIFRVLAKDTEGIFREIYPVDVSGGTAPTSFTDGLNINGIPCRYDKLGNSFFLDPVPNYNSDGGLKVYISREGSYFTTNDTTKKAGFAGIFHEYLALRPSYQYAVRNSLPNINSLKNEMLELENAIGEYYKSREKDSRKVLTPAINNSR